MSPRPKQETESQALRAKIKRSLRAQGFRLRGGRILPPEQLTKRKIRELHSTAVAHRLERSESGLRRHEPRLIQHIASGNEVSPELFAPSLIEVHAGSEEELLFRYASLHWSIPVSSGYGRRLRFLVIDGHNSKLVGILGLGDPVFALGPRDRWVGWDREQRRQTLVHVMEAFVLGAVPPYSSLLAGKLIAMLIASTEVRQTFARKYSSRSSRIGERKHSGDLAMVTTSSALGRSSIYNRLKLDGQYILEPIGFSSGSGDFHFSNGLYQQIASYAERWCEPTAKQAKWGDGFRNKREVVRKTLGQLGLPLDWQYHGIQRQVFAARLAVNTREFLRGEESRLEYFERPADSLVQWFRERWFLPRSRRDRRFLDFDSSSYLLWRGGERMRRSDRRSDGRVQRPEALDAALEGGIETC